MSAIEQGTVMQKPPPILLPELENMLGQRPARVAEAIRRVVGDVRPCVQMESVRASSVPIEGTRFNRWMRRPRPAPVLPVMVSKFGGMPYQESRTDIDGAWQFLGQINFADVRDALSKAAFPVPEGLPKAGVLAVDVMTRSFSTRTRWYPHASETKAVQSERVSCRAKYEAAIRFRGSWSMQGLEWFDVAPEGDTELRNFMIDLEIPGVDEDSRGGHKLMGHANEVLNEHYGLEPVAGRSDDIREYRLLWRITFDNAADFAWGTNWLYVVIHKDDLARGALENAIVTGGNA
jgi:hypothetical protein